MSWQSAGTIQVIYIITSQGERSQGERSRTMTRLSTGISTGKAGPAEFGYAHSDRLRSLRPAMVTLVGYVQLNWSSIQMNGYQNDNRV